MLPGGARQVFAMFTQICKDKHAQHHAHAHHKHTKHAIHMHIKQRNSTKKEQVAVPAAAGAWPWRAVDERETESQKFGK